MKDTLVVFDIGGVLVPRANRTEDLIAYIEAKIAENRSEQLDVKAFETAYWQYREAYDLGESDLSYWGSVLRAANATLPEQTIADIARFDAQQCAAIGTVEQQLLQALGNAEFPLALLSNAPHAMAEAVSAASWYEGFSLAVFSSQAKVAKPNRAAYDAITTVADDAELSFKRCVFFDDREENILGARAAGWDAHLWESAHVAAEILSVNLPDPATST